jgi:hypothetical protein
MYPNLHLAGNIIRMQGGETAKREAELKEAEEVLKMELESHPNVYYVYTEDMPMKEEELAPKEVK